MMRHRRFFLAFLLGLAAIGAGQLGALGLLLTVLLGASVFFLAYLALMAHFARGLTAEGMRAHAAAGDEGVALILALALAALGISLTAIILVLNGPGGGKAIERATALLSVPLGWAMLHTLLAFHYAHLFYRPDEDGEGGLTFPGTAAPGPWDFLYASFTIGMTAQVSDVVVTGPQMRRTVLLHGIGAFFYNTVILALAVNAAVTAGAALGG